MDEPPRAAISANVMMPPPTMATAMIVSSRRLKPPLRDDAATVTGEFFGTAGDADAAVVAGANAVAGGADTSDVGDENSGATGDDGAGAGAVWFKGPLFALRHKRLLTPKSPVRTTHSVSRALLLTVKPSHRPRGAPDAARRVPRKTTR